MVTLTSRSVFQPPRMVDKVKNIRNLGSPLPQAFDDTQLTTSLFVRTPLEMTWLRNSPALSTGPFIQGTSPHRAWHSWRASQAARPPSPAPGRSSSGTGLRTGTQAAEWAPACSERCRVGALHALGKPSSTGAYAFRQPLFTLFHPGGGGGVVFFQR